jgi:hypothetical protein
LMLFTAHQFWPLFFFVVPAGIWCANNRSRLEPRFEIARLSGLLAFIWFLSLGYVLIVLWLDPRYFTITVYGAVLVVALWLRAPSTQRASFALIALLAAGNVSMIYLDNKELTFGERALVGLARAHDEPIYTDSNTLRGAGLLLEHAAPGHQVIAGSAPAGGLFFYNPRPAHILYHQETIEPQSKWTLVQRIMETPKLSARILRTSGLESVLPPVLIQKLDPPLHQCYLYRLPSAQ